MKKKIHNGFNKDFFNFKRNIKDIWNGKPSLVYSFWVIYVLYTSVLTGIAFYLGEVLDDSSTFANLLYILFVVFIFAFSIIASVGTLRSASKYIEVKKKNNSSSFWGKLAQLVIILAIIKSIIELFKLVKNL
jgi:ABC-type transport system involved in multi-copper enzyme maturation permease subunit